MPKFSPPADGGLPVFKGSIILLPHECSRSRDAALVSAMFVPEEAENVNERQRAG